MFDSCVQPASADIRSRPGFRLRQHDNVLGVAYEASLAYISQRRALNPRDLVTMVAFDHSAETVFSELEVTSPSAQLADMMLNVHPRGGTSFEVGLLHAYSHLQHSRVNGRAAVQMAWHPRPVFILLTDSGDCAGGTMSALQQIMALEGAAAGGHAPLTVHLLGFGGTVNEDYIRRLASVGRGTFHVCRQAADIGRLDLVSAFSALAERPDRPHAALMPRF